MVDGPETVWEIRLAVVASGTQAEELKGKIERLLCPDPDHAPPCPVPWQVSMSQVDRNDLSSYSTLLEQARIEQ